jgi:hypothetical protein
MNMRVMTMDSLLIAERWHSDTQKGFPILYKRFQMSVLDGLLLLFAMLSMMNSDVRTKALVLMARAFGALVLLRWMYLVWNNPHGLPIVTAHLRVLSYRGGLLI